MSVIRRKQIINFDISIIKFTHVKCLPYIFRSYKSLFRETYFLKVLYGYIGFSLLSSKWGIYTINTIYIYIPSTIIVGTRVILISIQKRMNYSSYTYVLIIPEMCVKRNFLILLFDISTYLYVFAMVLKSFLVRLFSFHS
jgi:hypothetical protein